MQGPPLPSLWDPDRLAQLVSNLVGNALEHGGDQRVTVVARGAEDDVLIRVHNDGRPIPEDVQPSIFEPFVRHVSGGRRCGGGFNTRNGTCCRSCPAAGRVHGAAVQLHEMPHNRQSESYTTRRGLLLTEALENAALELRVDTGPGVTDRDQRAGPLVATFTSTRPRFGVNLTALDRVREDSTSRSGSAAGSSDTSRIGHSALSRVDFQHSHPQWYR